jgi:hypothetical protein
MQANKDGFYYVIDRQTGEFISGQPFVTVTWAKGLDEKSGRPIVNQEAKYGAQSITITPGAGGAHNWAPMSFNPATGLVYIPSSNGGMGYAVQEDFQYDPAKQNLGVVFNFGGRGGPGGGRGGPGAPANAAPEVANAAPAAPPPAPSAPPKQLPPPPGIGPGPAQEGGRGQLRAWDPVAQQARWSAPTGAGIGGGTVSTAGNLVLQVTPEGRLIAYSADKGEKLLDINTGLRGAMGPPITYQIDGKQYVALMGGQGTVPGRGGPPPGAAGPGAAPGGATAQAPGGRGGNAPAPVMPKLLVFALDANTPLPDRVQ